MPVGVDGLCGAIDDRPTVAIAELLCERGQPDEIVFTGDRGSVHPQRLQVKAEQRRKSAVRAMAGSKTVVVFAK